MHSDFWSDSLRHFCKIRASLWQICRHRAGLISAGFIIQLLSLKLSYFFWVLSSLCSSATLAAWETEADKSSASPLWRTRPVQNWSNQDLVFSTVPVSHTSTESRVGWATHACSRCETIETLFIYCTSSCNLFSAHIHLLMLSNIILCPMCLETVLERRLLPVSLFSP